MKSLLLIPLVILLVAAFTWMQTARLIRGCFLTLKEQEFAEAARAVGASDRRIIFRHLLPNAVAPLSVAAALLVGRVIVMESVLSFLGLGVQPPMPSWGNLLYGAQNYLATEPWLATFPGVFIFIAVLDNQANANILRVINHPLPDFYVRIKL